MLNTETKFRRSATLGAELQKFGKTTLIVLLTFMAIGDRTLDAATTARGVAEAVEQDVPLYNRASKWRCDVESKFLCFENKCRRFNIAHENERHEKQFIYWIELDFARHSYSRCDQNGCNDVDVGTSSGAGYTLIEPGGGAFLKVDNISREFVDVATLGTGVTTSFGICLPIRG